MRMKISEERVCDEKDTVEQRNGNRKKECKNKSAMYEIGINLDPSKSKSKKIV